MPNMRLIELSVGFFMLAGILALMFLAFKVSKLDTSGGDDSYQLKAKFDNLAGLTKRAKVTVAGVNIGKVVDIALDQEAYSAEVTLEISKEFDSIPTDSAAAILTEGLLGGKYIGLSIGADEEFYTDGDLIEDTQSGLILEELIGQFLLNSTSD